MTIEIDEGGLTHLGGGTDIRAWTVGIYQIPGRERELCECGNHTAGLLITLLSHPDEDYERTTHKYELCKTCAQKLLTNRGARITWRGSGNGQW